MRNFYRQLSYWLIGGASLLALGPAQLNPTQQSRPDRNLFHAHAAHRVASAPMIRSYGPNGVPLFGPNNEIESKNWSGYAVSSGTYMSAQATWTVPAVNYQPYSGSPNKEDSVTWVGIGGYSTSDLIQLGTEGYVSDGSTTYQAWYAMLPGYEIVLGLDYYVSPGDVITASLSCTASCTPNASQTWALSMTDTTQQWTFSQTFTYTSSFSSAEWIQEAPISTTGSVLPLVNYGSVKFTNIAANGANPNLSLSADGVIMEDPNGGNSTPCPAVNGNQFTVDDGTICPSRAMTHDFNGDGKSDILWQNTSGSVAMWLMNGASILQSAGVGTVSPTVWSIAGQHDFNADGKADILWHDSSGDVAVWLMNGAGISQSLGVGNANPGVWSIVGTGDFFGNGNGDVLWRDTSGDVAIWELSGNTIVQSCGVGTAPTNWSIAGTGDFNGDGKTDILWHDTSGDVAIWEMNGCSILQSLGVGTVNPSVWSIAGTGDFSGVGRSAILWHDTSGDVAIWFMNGATITQSAGVGTANPSVWSIAQTGDYYGAGTSDILWHDTSGDVAVWQMNGATIVQSAGIGTAPTVWSIQDAGAD